VFTNNQQIAEVKEYLNQNKKIQMVHQTQQLQARSFVAIVHDVILTPRHKVAGQCTKLPWFVEAFVEQTLLFPDTSSS
jgi:hypothetical protein